MRKIKKKTLSFVVLLVFTLSLLMQLFSHPTHAADNNEETVYLSAQQTVLSLMDTKEEAVYGNEWLVLDLVRDEQAVSPYYLKDLIDTIIAKEGVLHTGRGDYTNYAKAVLILTALGIDPTNIAGYNLIESVSHYPMVAQQGVNGVIYALLALDCGNYEIKVPDNLPFIITRDTYIKSILNNQLADGGWDWAGKQADPDMTAMAVQALAPYYDSNEDVKSAVDNALQTLSNLQQPDGGFQTEDAAYEESSESTSMVILALTTLGIDPTKDPRFIKEGNTTIDNLCSFAVNGGFSHTKGGLYNDLSTDQGYRALVAYHRLLEGKTSFYDMSDITTSGAEELITISSALTEKILMQEIAETADMEDIISKISSSPAFVEMDGKIECVFDLQFVLSDDANTVVFPLSESDVPQTITVTVPEEKLSELGEDVLVIGIHNGEVFSIEPDSVDRSIGSVVFKASKFSVYSIVSGTTAADPASEDGSKSVEPAQTGDNTYCILWTLLMAVSIFGVLIFGRVYKQTK